MRSPYSITVRLAFAGGASRRASAPVEVRRGGAHAAAVGDDDRVLPPQLVDRGGDARLQLGERLGVRRRELPALPGGDVGRVELVERVAGPVADVDLAPAPVVGRAAEPERLRGLHRAREV